MAELEYTERMVYEQLIKDMKRNLIESGLPTPLIRAPKQECKSNDITEPENANETNQFVKKRIKALYDQMIASDESKQEAVRSDVCVGCIEKRLRKTNEIISVLPPHSKVLGYLNRADQCMTFSRESVVRNFFSAVKSQHDELDGLEETVLRMLGDEKKIPSVSEPDVSRPSKPSVRLRPGINACLTKLNGKCTKQVRKQNNRLYLVASESMKVCELIATGFPLCWVTNAESRYERCDFCLCNKTTILIPCYRGCKLTMYCSQECQDDAWRQYHQVECFVMQVLNNCDKLERWFLKVLRMLSVGLLLYQYDTQLLREHFEMREQPNDFSVNSIAKATQQEIFGAMMRLRKTRNQLTDVPQNATVCSLHAVIMKYFAINFNIEPEPGFLAQFIQHLVQLSQMFSMNNYVLLRKQSKHAIMHYKKSFAESYYPMYELFEYSNEPNVMMVTIGPMHRYAITVRPVKKGERLTIAHITYRRSVRENLIYSLDGHSDLDTDCGCPSCRCLREKVSVNQSSQEENNAVSLRIQRTLITQHNRLNNLVANLLLDKNLRLIEECEKCHDYIRFA